MGRDSAGCMRRVWTEKDFHVVEAVPDSGPQRAGRDR